MEEYYYIRDHLDTIFIWIADTISRHSMVSCDYSCSWHFCTNNGEKRASPWYRVATSNISFLSLRFCNTHTSGELYWELKRIIEWLEWKIGEYSCDQPVSITFQFTEKDKNDSFTEEECRSCELINRNFWYEIDILLKRYLTDEDQTKKVVRTSQVNVDMILQWMHEV